MMGAAPILDWAIALVPVLLLLGLFASLDVFHIVAGNALVRLLGLGALAALLSYPASGAFLDTLPIGFSRYSRFAAPWIEEALKSAMVVGLFLRNRVGYKIDAALSGFAIGAGFAIVENIIYLVRFPDVGPGVWLVRGIGTAVMHGGTVAVFATLSHQLCERAMIARNSPSLALSRFVPGYLAAVLIHAGFNQFPDQPLLAMALTILVVPLTLLVIFGLGAGEARNWLKTEAAQHRADLAALGRGDLPDTPSGRRVAALAASQADPAAASAILHYWRVLAELVLGAECSMLERTDGHAADRDADADRIRFARLAEMERCLDHGVLIVLRRMLPFSRNDLWEVAKLREQLGSF